MTEGDRPAKRPRTSPAGPSWDVVVVGLGALGSAAAWVLARSGARVLALEQFELGHHRGASHDHARIIRRSYHTPAYVRLAGLAYRAWAELEWEAEERLVVTTGGLDLFPADSAIPHGPYRSSLETCGVPYQWLDAAEVMRRWPAFHLDADVHGLWQPDAGMVPATRGTRVVQRLAAGYGATLVSQAPVTAVRDLGGSVEVATPEASFRAGRLLLCTDAWTGDLLAQLGAALPLVVTQEQFSYFRPADPAAFAVGRFPVWIWMDDPSFYGFPVWPDTALKAAQDVGGPRVTATTRGFDPDPAASERLAGFLRARLPAAVGAHDHTATCLSTLTPDRDLVLGPSPAMTASWSPSAPPTASSSPPCSAGSWPTWPCTAAPTSTSPRSPPTARPSPPPSRRPGTWSEALDAAVTVVGTMPERSGPHLACECRHKGGHEEPAHRHPDRGRARLSAGRTRCPRGPA